MLVGIFFGKLYKYPDFDFKPLKNTQIATFRAVLRAVLGKWLQFSKTFPKDPKKKKIRILYLKKYDEHTYHFTMEVPPPLRGGGVTNSCAATNLSFPSLSKLEFG